jgi:hypothetical protein
VTTLNCEIRFLGCSTLKMEAAKSSETLVSNHNTLHGATARKIANFILTPRKKTQISRHVELHLLSDDNWLSLISHRIGSIASICILPLCHANESQSVCRRFLFMWTHTQSSDNLFSCTFNTVQASLLHSGPRVINKLF